MRIVYFAWIREHIGKPEEVLDVPEGVETVTQVMDWLAGLGEGHQMAFRDKSKIRVAVDQTFAGPDQRLAGAKEIAFFPPVTGG